MKNEREAENPMALGECCRYAEPYGVCDVCGREVCEGDEMFRIWDMLLCAGCVRSGRAVAGDAR